MITEFKHFLIPGWVAAGKFPDANEDKLKDLAEAWRSISDHSQQAETSVGQEASKLFTTWTGDAATSAQSQVSTVQKWIVSIEASGEVMERGTLQAVAYVINTKTAINNILQALANATKKSIAAGLLNPLDAPRLAAEVTMMQTWARTQISRYYDALTNMLGSISFKADVQPDVRTTASGGGGTGGTAGGATGGGAINVTQVSNLSGSTQPPLVPATVKPDGTPIAEEEIKERLPTGEVVLHDGTVIPPQPAAPDTEAAGAPPTTPATDPADPTLPIAQAGAAAGAVTLPWSTGLAQVKNPDSVPKEEEVGGDKNDEVVEDAAEKLKKEIEEVPEGLDEQIQSGAAAGQQTQQQVQEIQQNIATGSGEAQQGRDGVQQARQDVQQGAQQVSYQSLPDQVRYDQTGYTPPEPVRPPVDPTPANPGPSGPTHNPPPVYNGGGGDLPSTGPSAGHSAPNSGTFGTTEDPTQGTSTGMGTSHGSSGTTTSLSGSGNPGGSGTGSSYNSGGGSGTGSSYNSGGSSGSGTGGLPPVNTGTGAAGVSAPVAPMPVSSMPPGGAMPGGGFGGPPMGGGSYGSTPLLGGSGFGGPSAAPSVGVGGLGAPAAPAAPVGPAPAAGGGIPAAPAAPAASGVMGGGTPGGIPAAGVGSTGGAPAAPGAAAVAAPGTGAPGSNPGGAQPGAVVAQPSAIGPAQPGQPGSSSGTGTSSGSAAGAGAGRADTGAGLSPTEAAVTVAAAIATLGLAGAAAMHFSHLWSDLRANPIVQPRNGGLLPTQFGPTDQQSAMLPAGLSGAYQKVLLPGEAEALMDGQITTLRGIVNPLDQVAHLTTPEELYAVLGLGFAIQGRAGADSLAFSRDADTIEVLRFAGLRMEDLITPVEADVTLPANTVPLPLVRHHARPWNGTGEAPGSTSTEPIDEHEILGYAAVPLPHLAEIWRLHADGTAEYVSTYNARNASWVGSTSPARPAGERIENGAFATLSDGNVFEIVPLSDQFTILVARGQAPEGFLPAQDGTSRIQVANEHIASVRGVTTIGLWQGQPVQLLERSGGSTLVDYAGDDPHSAAMAGFVQVNQGQWQTRWVPQAELSGVQTLERSYAMAAAAGPAIPQSPSPAPEFGFEGTNAQFDHARA